MKIRICYLAMAVTALFACASIAPAAPPSSKAPKTQIGKSKPKSQVGKTKPKSKTKVKSKRKTKAKAKAKPVAKKVGQVSTAENGLVGVKLYDPGSRLITMFGSPTDIQGISLGGSAVGSGGGAGPGAGPAGPGAGPMGPGQPGVASPDMSSAGFGDDPFLFAPPGGGAAPPAVGNAGGGAAAPGGAAPGGATPGGGGGGSAQAGNRIIFTRWVFKRGGSRYGFILDKFNRVVEIEAIGLSDPRVRTKKGIGFGASFGTIIKKYGAPDAYEIMGNSLVVRYLVRNKVAFRLNRLGMDKPHVVTGVVVAAGKT